MSDVERKRQDRWRSLCTAACSEDSGKRRTVKQANDDDVGAIASNGAGRRSDSVTSCNHRKEWSAFIVTAVVDRSSHRNGNCDKSRSDIELRSIEVVAMPQPTPVDSGKANDEHAL